MSENELDGQADEETPQVRWAAELHRHDDAAGTSRTVLRVITEDPAAAAAALRAAADRIDVPRPYVAAGRPVAPVASQAKAGARLFWALYYHPKADELLKDASPGFLKARRQAQNAFDPQLDTAGWRRHVCAEKRGAWATPGDVERCGCPVVSQDATAPAAAASATQSAQGAPAGGTDTPGAPGGAEGPAMLRADSEPTQTRPRSRTVSKDGRCVTNSYLHAVNPGNEITAGDKKTTPHEVRAVFVDGRLETVTLIGRRGQDIVWAPGCGWELPEHLRDVADPGQCAVETSAERRRRLGADQPPVVSGPEVFHAALDVAANGRTPIAVRRALGREALLVEVARLNGRLERANERIVSLVRQRDGLFTKRNRLEQVCEELAHHVDDTVLAEVWPERGDWMRKAADRD